MTVAPQEVRTFFVTSVAQGRRAILQSAQMAGLLMDVFRENRKKRRFFLHEFVIMPDHFHLLITPAEEVRLEKPFSTSKVDLLFVRGRSWPSMASSCRRVSPTI